LVSYKRNGKRYLQIVRDIKKRGRRTTRTVTHLGLETEWNREKAEELVNFLNRYSEPKAPIAVGTIDEDFLAGLRLGILLGPLSLPIAPIVLFRDFIYSLNYYLAHPSGDIEQAVDATQMHLSEEDRRRLVKWIESIPYTRDKAIALFFKWSYEE